MSDDIQALADAMSAMVDEAKRAKCVSPSEATMGVGGLIVGALIVIAKRLDRQQPVLRSVKWRKK